STTDPRPGRPQPGVVTPPRQAGTRGACPIPPIPPTGGADSPTATARPTRASGARSTAAANGRSPEIPPTAAAPRPSKERLGSRAAVPAPRDPFQAAPELGACPEPRCTRSTAPR